jgi:thiaminase/transcriptional activator TenA
MSYIAQMVSDFTGSMREAALDEWQTATTHRLFGEIIDDSVSDADFERYLRIEFAFIDTAAIALGAAIQIAPDMADRAVLAAGLHDLLTSQVEFFEDALGEDRHTIKPASARGLHALFAEVAEGDRYTDLLAAMLGAEWLYMTWCAKTADRRSSRTTIAAWTALHRTEAFVGHVAWLRGRLEALATGMNDVDRETTSAVFRRALAAEIRFHDAVFET